MKNLKRLSLIGAAVAALVTGFAGAPAAHAEGAHYYILIGGTCNGNADQYQEAWLRGGIRKVVNYPAGASGLPGPCGQTPMDQSVAIGREEAKRVVQESFDADPGGEFLSAPGTGWRSGCHPDCSCWSAARRRACAEVVGGLLV
ncbi:hypothetical protein M8542_02655 [Amycolatopsis sp. OK19-0408]|uniref:Uncharacterized protein n=1 Tax=Amycolatopsis iheyensis TaxID=2945988 RepID=A0A9X2N6F9_9PSEU|nr:hypothetical protein [Amycolatopsis iheyensis]MCR6481708.1 hypothetical protein [Amycolatopsis iheyensis]